MSKYPALVGISGIYRIIGWIAIGAGAFAVVVAAVAADETPWGLATMLVGAVVVAASGVTWLGFGELIKVFMDIEKNTRPRSENAKSQGIVTKE